MLVGIIPTLSADNQLHLLGLDDPLPGCSHRGVHCRCGDERREIRGYDHICDRRVGWGDRAEVPGIAVRAVESRSRDLNPDGCGEAVLGVHREREVDRISGPGCDGCGRHADGECTGAVVGSDASVATGIPDVGVGDGPVSPGEGGAPPSWRVM